MRLSCVVLLLLSALTLCRAWGDDAVPYTLNITSPQIYGGVMDAFRTQGLTVGYWASFTQNVGDRVRMRLALPPTGQDTACCLPPSCKFDMSLQQTLREWAAMQGSLLLIRRGDCLFHLKLIVAQNFGAAGAVVINDDDSPLLMAGSDGLPAVSIPGFAIGRTLGDFLEVTVQKSAVSVWVELAVVPIHFPMLGYVMTTAGTLAIVLCLLVPCILCCRLRSRRRLVRTTVQLDVLQPAHHGSFSAMPAAPILGVPLHTVPLAVSGVPLPPPSAASANPSCGAALSRTGSLPLPKGLEAAYAMPHSEGGVPSASPVLYGPLVELEPNSRQEHAISCHSPSMEEWKSLV